MEAGGFEAWAGIYGANLKVGTKVSSGNAVALQPVFWYNFSHMESSSLLLAEHLWLTFFSHHL
jgi:hypothetical protein